MNKKSCIFCDIINRKAEASIVYEDELVIAFHDAFPLNPGHILVVPKTHARDISELDQLTLWSMIRVAQKISCAMPTASGIECTGVNIFMANGPMGILQARRLRMLICMCYPGQMVTASGLAGLPP